jgi:hypothetical protein
MATQRTTAEVLMQLANLNPAALEDDPNMKSKALALSRQLTAMLESPMEHAVEYAFKVCYIQDPASLRHIFH